MWIVGGAAAPEAAAENHKRLTTQLDLLASVPDAVRKSFDRIRSIYRQGLFYDLYTVAGDQARLLIELALKERFVEFYGGTVLFMTGRATRRPRPEHGKAPPHLTPWPPRLASRIATDEPRTARENRRSALLSNW